MGQRRLSDKRHYSKKPVKDALRKMHRDKCCYCETKLRTPAHLHVEHFRPKAAVRQSRLDVNEVPGYFWLAYSWDNLLLACFDCNTTYKNTLFPLEDPSRRARSHNDDLTKEREQFVNPTIEDPRDHIRFQDDLPIAQTERGHQTIEGLGLRRLALTEERLELFRIVQVFIQIVQMAPAADIRDLQDEASRFLDAARRPDAKFSSMVMDYLALNGI